jgi:tetratricopeptide (TPR) repeat protein
VRPLIAALAIGVTVAACARSAADHEELGDRAYAAGSYRDALAEYRLALLASPGRASLHAKAAAAAVRNEEFAFALAEYRALAMADRARLSEAIDGLERVVRAALRANERGVGETALATLRVLAPDRPLGVYARAVAVDAAEQGRFAEARALLPPAIATAVDDRNADSLLYVYGLVATRARDCAVAVPAFETVLRRGREPAVVDAAREGIGLCALLEGRRALEAGRTAEADEWLRRATAPGAAPDVARAAFLGLGDIRLAQGDVAGALESYQRVLQDGTPGDTLSLRAQERINAVGRAESPAPLQP